jgi:alpha-N-arabinofuranosidase
MDGPWQICRKTATEYGRIAAEAGKVMKWVDPSIVVSSCGSSARSMPTFGAWEYEVLDHTMDITDFVSLHMYYENPLGDVQEFLANVELMDHFIKETIAVCDAVAAKRKSLKRVMLSMDEWNVWYKARSGEHMAKPGWPVAPPLIEEIYDLQDALMVGGALITLLNNADRVKVACQAQLVNVIGMIFAEPGGAAWRQTIFHPFKIVTEQAHGSVLEVKVQSDQHETKTAGVVDDIVAAAVHDVAKSKVSFFILNREANGTVEVSLDLHGFPPATGCTAVAISGPDLLATNSAAKPNSIIPKEHNEFSVKADKVVAKLPPMSWNMLSISY